MKKIMFNDKYGLTKAVLEGRKTQTRRVLNPTMFFQRLETYEGWSKEDISAWKRSCKRRFYEAQGNILQQMLDYALSSSRYKVGEEVAIAQSYKNIHDEILSVVGDLELKQEFLKAKGYTNKMFVRADKMPHRIRITDIRAERLQEISDDDCLAEGISPSDPDAKAAYAALIDHISGKGTWASNPYVFVYEFELVK